MESEWVFRGELLCRGVGLYGGSTGSWWILQMIGVFFWGREKLQGLGLGVLQEWCSLFWSEVGGTVRWVTWCKFIELADTPDFCPFL